MKDKNISMEPFTTQSRLLTTLRRTVFFFFNIVGHGENAGYQVKYICSSANTSNLDSKISIFDKELTISQITLRRRLLKALWEKEKMLVTSIFSFSHNVSHPSKTNFSFSVLFILASANFSLDQS